MFERFTMAARQSLFCALYKAGERKGDQIAGQDLLGGLMMVAANEILRFASEDAEFLRPALTLEQWRMQLQDELAAGGTASRLDQELPFSSNVKLALQRTVQEADDLRHRFIRPEHLLLGLLREEDTEEWRTLQKVGITLREVRHVLSEEADVAPGEDGTW
jgi:ATP-dependent Clp protease ATP-binding subunit ClpC